VCRDCPELLDAVRQQIEQWQLDTSGGRSSFQLPLDDTGQPAVAPPAVHTAAGVHLQPGAEPVPGYRLEKRLGKGSFGEVWRATGPGSGPVAPKFIELKGEAHPGGQRAPEPMKQARHPPPLDVSAHRPTAGPPVRPLALA